MAHRDVIVMGASAGGVEALRSVVAGLPPDLDAAVFIVLHLPRTAPSALTPILSRATSLSVSTAIDGEAVQPGHVYVAPVDHHLLLIEGRTRLSRGPAENGHRPAVDPLFRSAALAYASRVIGVVLSGSRDDGAAGMAAIARAGGVTIVQDPDDAPHPSMPNSAIAAARIDHICPVIKIGPLIGEIVTQEAPAVQAQTEPLLESEVEIAQAVPGGEDAIGRPAGLGCPACGGSLFEVEDSPIPRYRCRIGHAWSPESLLEEQSSALESALSMALRALADKAALGRRMAEKFPDYRYASTRERFEAVAREADHAGDLIRDLLSRIGGAAGD